MMNGMGFFWLAIILGAVWLVRDSVERQQSESPRENALTVLGRRCAEGAITLDEYEQRRDVLTGAAAPHTDQDATALAKERS
jgi:uncharacterized membrane protein